MNYVYQLGNLISLRILLTFLITGFGALVASAQINSFPHTEDWESQTTCSTSSTCNTVCTLTNGWTNPTTDDDSDWRVNTGTTTSSGTGPSFDHTTGTASGKYLYLESSCSLSNEAADLVSPSIDLTGLSNLSMDLWYHMFGADMPNASLQVDVTTDGGVTWTNVEAPFTDNQDLWQVKTIVLNAYVGSIIQVRIRGIAGTTFTSDIAIDDITFYEVSNNDAGIASIDAPVTPASPGVNNIEVTIANFGLANLTSTDINWSVDGGTVSTFNWTHGGAGIPQGSSESGIIAGSFNFPAGTHDIAAWTSNPNGGSDGEHSNDSAFTSVLFCDPLSGIFTIDQSSPASATNFTSFQSAIDAMVVCGLGGAVTFNVASLSGPYTGQVMIPSITGASSINTITFNGNGEILTHSGLSSDRATVTLDGASFITVNDFVIDATGTTYGWGVHLYNDANNNTISNNTINIASTSTSSSNSAGILLNGSTSSMFTGDDDVINNTLTGNTVTGGYVGIALAGVSAGMSGNVVSHNHVIDFYTEGIWFEETSGIEVFNNEIYRVNRTSVTTTYMIALDTDNIGAKVYNNKIHDPFAADITSSSTVYGIYNNSNNVSSGLSANTNTIYNNLVYNFASGGTQYGIYSTFDELLNVYHNTIVLDEQNTAATSSNTYGFYQSSDDTELNEVKNNIFYLTRSGPSYTGDVTGIKVDAALTFMASDNNVIYSASSTGTNYVGSTGTSGGYSTLVDWNTATGFDGNSKTVDPVFSMIAPDEYMPTSSAINNIGVDVGITTDITGNARDPFSPDPGVYEFTPVGLDANITWIAPVNPVSAGNQTVIVNISNTQTATINSVSLSYTDGFVIETETFSSLSLTAGNNVDLTFSTPYNLTGTANLYAYINSVNGGADDDQSNDTTVVITICPSVSGVFTIDTSQPTGGSNYNSFTDAVNDLITCGIGGPVTFNVVAGSGPYNEQIAIPEIVGNNSTNTITFNGNGETIAFSSSDGNNRAVIRLEGADYVTIDNLVVDASGAGTYGWGIHLMNESDNATISNNNVVTDVTSTSSVNYGGIVASGSLTSMISSGNNTNNTTIINNSITGGYYGITLFGTSTSVTSSGNQIIDNTIVDNYLYGLRVQYQDGVIIKGNDVTQRMTTSTSGYGLYSIGLDGTTEIIGNRFDGWGTYGIYLSSFNNSGVVRPTVANNMLSSNPTTGTYGIYMPSSDEVNVWFNSVSIGGTGRALYSSSSSNTGLDIRNNSFAYFGGSTGYAMYVSSTSSILACDYNNYYSNGSNFVNYGGAKTDLADLQATNVPAGNDANSKKGDPQYISSTNLHSLGTQLNNSGTPISGITEDIDGETRDLTNPDIGADEYTPPTLDVGPSALISPPAGGCIDPSSDVIVEVTNFGVDPIDFSTNNLTVTANITGPLNQSVNTTVSTGTLNPGNTINVNLGSVNLSSNGTYTFDITTSLPGDGIALNDNLNVVVENNSISTYPYFEDFETGGTVGFPSVFPSGWIADPYATSSGTFGFALDFGGTVSGSTGPEYDHTNFGVTDGGNYVYMETSGGSTGDEAMFVSPCIDFTSNPAPAMSFWYHMHGATIGELHVDVSADNGATWDLDVMTPIVGEQQTSDVDPWLQETVFLDAYGGQSVLIRFRGVRGSSFTGDIAVDDINIFQQPPCDPLTLTAGTASANKNEGCGGDEFVLTLDGHSTGVGLTIQWEVSTDGGVTFTQIAGANTNTYQTGPLAGNDYFYQAVVTCDPNSVTSNTVNITVNDPQITSVTGDTVCGIGEVTLSATSNEGDIFWYDDLNSQTPIDTGATFTTTISSTTTYYVSAVTGGGSETAGKAAPSSTTNTTGNGWGLVFDVLNTPINLVSVDIYSVGSSSGTISVELTDNTGTVLETAGPFSYPSGSTSNPTVVTLPLNFSVPVGTGYRMVSASMSGGSVIRESSGNTYPYNSPSGNISVTSGYISGTSSTYYWFYNWQVGTGCTSDKVAVTAVSTPAPPVEISGTSTICEGGTSTLSITTGISDYTNFEWSPSNGLSSTTGSSVDASPDSSTTYIVTASGNINGCQTKDTFDLDVINVVVDITTDNTIVCGNEVAQLNALVTAQNLFTNFANPDSIFIPGSGTGTSSGEPANPYPSVINVSGISANAMFSSVTIKGIHHTFADDIDIALVSPNGEVVVLMSDIGSSFDLTGETYTFSNDASATMADLSSGNPSGTYLPTNSGSTDSYPAPGPGSVTQANPTMTDFVADPNGTWSLFVVDDASGDIGFITDGWEIEFIDPSSLSYSWSPATGLSSTTIADPTAVPPTVGGSETYTVVVTETISGCSSSASITIYREDPVITSTTDDTRCGLGDVTLTASGSSGTIYWWDQSIGGQPVATGSPYEPFLTETTTFYTSTVAEAVNTTISTGFDGGTIATDPNAAGNMFDIVAVDNIILNSFDIHLNNNTSLAPSDISVYYKEGTYVGSHFNENAWTLVGSVSGVVSAGNNVPTSLPLNLNLHLSAGQTYGVYIVVTNLGVSNSLRYTGQANSPELGDVAVEDNNIQILTGTVIFGPFTGQLASPTNRMWNGNVNYSLVCESSRVPVTGTVTPAPVVEISGGPVVCGGESITLTVTTGTSDYTNFEWSPATGLSSTTGTSVIASPTEDISYVVLASGNVNGCQNTDTIDIDVVTPPSVTASANQTFFCDVANAQLLAEGGTPPEVAGKPAPTSTSNTNGSGWGLVFDVINDPILLESVDIYSVGSGGSITIDFMDNTGSVIQVLGPFNYPSGTTTNPTIVTLPLNLNVPVGTGFRLLSSSMSGNLIREFSSENNFPYPSASGNVSVTSGYISGTSQTYYWFYNWQIGGSVVNYSWTPTTGLSDPSKSNPVASPSVTTTYIVTVTDTATGCTATDSVTIVVGETPTPVISSTQSMPLCEGETTELSTQYTAANGFTFSWNSGLFTTESITVDVAGTYNVVVTSPDGCTSTLVTFDVEISTIFADVLEIIDASCFGGSDGSVEIEALGAITEPQFDIYFGPFDYAVDGGALQSSPLFTGLAAGTYTFEVHDPTTGCVLFIPATVGEAPEIVPGPVVINQNVSCNGGNDGSATVSATGGTGVLTYTWNTPVPKQGELNEEIPAGTWTVTVTDENGCTATMEVTITEPPALTVSFNVTDATFWSAENGAIEAIVSGGTPPYDYLWNTGATTSTIGGLSAGTYTLTITDDNGCVLVETAVVNEPPFDCVNGTQTHFIQGPGGWGGQPSGNNPATYLYANFAAGFPNGLTIGHPAGTPGGCNRSITLTSEQAVTDFLPSAGQPRRLDPGHQVNITASQYGNIFASMTVALTLEVVFDTLDPNFSPASTVALGDMVYVGGGPYNGMTVYQILDAANEMLACGGKKNELSQLNTVIDNILHQPSVLGCPASPVVRNVTPHFNNTPAQDDININVYPNPSSGIINISFESDAVVPTDIIIMDMQGRTVMHITNNMGNNFVREINLSHVDNGLYIINFINEKGLIKSSRISKVE